MLNKTIRNLENAGPVHQDRVAVLVCPALTYERFEQEMKTHNVIFQLFKKPFEFVKLQARHSDYPLYEKNVAVYALSELLEIEENTLAKVVLNANYSDFKNIVKSRKYRLLFLVAHHIHLNKDKDYVEFADGGIPFSTVSSFLKMNQPDDVSIMLFVCTSEYFNETLYEETDLPQSIATAYWNVPYVEALRFIKTWIYSIRNNSISESYETAVNNFLNM
jgi:hypothetical protein